MITNPIPRRIMTNLGVGGWAGQQQQSGRPWPPYRQAMRLMRPPHRAMLCWRLGANYSWQRYHLQDHPKPFYKDVEPKPLYPSSAIVHG
jgi:hypothetical protein